MKCRRADLNFGKPAQKFRQQRNDDRAQNSARHRTHPADDDHNNNLERPYKLKIVGMEEFVVMGEKHARDSRKSRTDDKRSNFVARRIDAHRFRGQFVFAD